MTDIVASLVVMLLGFALVSVATVRTPLPERSYVRFALVFHYVLGITMYVVMERVFVISDVHSYLNTGEVVASLIAANPGKWLVEILKSMLFMPNDLPMGGGGSANMMCFAGLGLLLTGSIWGTFLIFAGMSFVGKWALYAGLRDELNWSDRRPLMIAAMLIPSCVFWTSGLVKEAFAIGGLGVLFRGTQLMLRRFSIVGVGFIAYGAVLTAAFKPYFLFAFVIGAGLWILFAKVERAAKYAPLLFVGGLILGIAGVALLGRQFQDYSIDKVGHTIALQQSWVQQTSGGSDYAIGDPNSQSLASQAVFAPIALATTLVRPLPFEVHNAMSAIASLEMLVMTILLWRAVRGIGLRRAMSTLFGSPVLVFAVAFVLVGATGVGLATTNFGTLSRYRTPLLPFYALLIVALQNARSVAVRGAQRFAVPPRPAGRRVVTSSSAAARALTRRFSAPDT